ncbi:hypothetical protein CBL_07396 [Carabus blaptoides fortunei]
MKYKQFLFCILGVLIFAYGEVQGKPTPQRDGTANIIACLDIYCDNDSGPVCGIDASGFPRTFENRCLAKLAYCREGRYYVEIKGGEC